MAKQGRYPQELRERAVRMVQEHRGEYPSGWQATQSIAGKFGMHPVTLHEWVKRAEIDAGQRAGLSTSERERLKQLERENRELRRANEMADSSGERNGSCEMSHSQEDVDARGAWPSFAGTEATGVPAPGARLAVG